MFCLLYYNIPKGRFAGGVSKGLWLDLGLLGLQPVSMVTATGHCMPGRQDVIIKLTESLSCAGLPPTPSPL